MFIHYIEINFIILISEHKINLFIDQIQAISIKQAFLFCEVATLECHLFNKSMPICRNMDLNVQLILRHFTKMAILL